MSELPAELAAIPDKVFGAPMEGRSVCAKHGPQNAPFCAECDKHFPDQVKAREISPSTPVGGTFTIDDVKRMISEALAQK